jgi:hypothetical protein
MGLRPRRTPLAAALVALAVAASGCGGSPLPSPPSGVDGLTIPTPSLDAGDFTGRVTNPWLALEPGAHWEYRSIDRGTRRVTVSGEHVQVQGISATVVHTEERTRGSAPSVRDDLYAQDRAGNVWLLGQRVLTGRGRSWQAGTGGAEAGLAMAAVPRRGDGYAVAAAPGVDERRAVVLSRDTQTVTPAGTYEHALLVECTSPLGPGVVTRQTYARGVGLVAEDDIQGGTGSWLLVPAG